MSSEEGSAIAEMSVYLTVSEAPDGMWITALDGPAGLWEMSSVIVAGIPRKDTLSPTRRSVLRCLEAAKVESEVRTLRRTFSARRS